MGWDPIAFLSMRAGVEQIVARIILQKALDIEAEREKLYWANMQTAVANGVSKGFG